MDNKLTNEIRALISQIAKEEIKKMSPNMEYVYDGEVEVVDNTTYINIKGQRYTTGTTGEIPNHSGETLTDGKKVRVYAKGDKMNNAYIGVVWQ